MTVNGKDPSPAMASGHFGVSEVHRSAGHRPGRLGARLSPYLDEHLWRSQANRSKRTWAEYPRIGRTLSRRRRSQGLGQQDRMHGRNRRRSYRSTAKAESIGLALCAVSVYVQIQGYDVQIFLFLPNREMQRAYVDGKKPKKAGENVLPQPVQPKIYHIVHVDRLPSIIKRGLLPDSVVRGNFSLAPEETNIGLDHIKKRRLEKVLPCYSDLCVGECVPFNFCPRSVMLYVIHRPERSELPYREGQDPVVHLEADLTKTIEFADENRLRWAFTNSNASTAYFDCWNNVQDLYRINWDAVQAGRWGGDGVSPTIKEGKQAEFLVEQSFAWQLVERIGVRTQETYAKVKVTLKSATHKPPVSVMNDWYY